MIAILQGLNPVGDAGMRNHVSAGRMSPLTGGLPVCCAPPMSADDLEEHPVEWGEITEPGRPGSRKLPFVAGWDRYEVLSQLGRGGMGVVYRARDRRDDRIVALKFVLEADPQTSKRLLREAQAQARINHPNVCKIYEVGEVQGHAYIALQYIDGVPIHEAREEMGLDASVAAIRDVAWAVHEAHRLGIVHRDLKPGNILVARTAAAGWIPYVMDFGLAREMLAGAQLSNSGVVLGTPAYMAPEQALGSALLDRRSDVYSIGATLYELLTGQPPFEGDSVPTLLRQLASHDPPPLRTLVPELPVALETITLKCLEKDPARRYASASALANDLTRYLDGMPILSRRPSPLRRVQRQLKKHRGWTAFSAGILVATCIAMLLGVNACVQSQRREEAAARRARLAERLGGEAQQIESALREAYLRPLHDLRPDRQAVRARMHHIQAELVGLDGESAAYVHAALGRAHLALREWSAAATELRAAQAAGLEMAADHVALGRALGELYLDALGNLGHSSDERAGATSWLAQRRAQVAADYLTPAAIEIGRGLAPGGMDLLRARLALYARDFVEAERRALRVSAADAGAAEALEIAGNAALLAGTGLLDQGDFDAAAPIVQRAAETYEKASQIARSDGALYRQAAEAWLQVVEVEAQRQRPFTVTLQHAVALLQEQALIADPDDASAYADVACAFMTWYRYGTFSGAKEEVAMLNQAVAAATHATNLDPSNDHALFIAGIAHARRGVHDITHGQPGEPWWRLALLELQRAAAVSPENPRFNNVIGFVQLWISEEMIRFGQDPSEEFKAADTHFAQALYNDPTYFKSCSNSVWLSTLSAEYAVTKGNNPKGILAEGGFKGERCLKLSSRAFVVLDHLARGLNAAATFALQSGEDPRPVLIKARALLDRSLPAHAEERGQRAIGYRIEAEYLLAHQQDAQGALKRARALLEQELSEVTESSAVLIELAKVVLLGAKAQTESAPHFMQEAISYAKQALSIDPRYPEAHLLLAEACLEQAALQGNTETLPCAVQHSATALQLNPRLAKAQSVLEAAQKAVVPAPK